VPPSVRLAELGGRAERQLAPALTVVAEALVAKARRRASEIVEAARSDADDELRHAANAVEAMIDRASDEGKTAAEHTAEALVAQARSDARSLVLSAEKRAYDALRRRSIETLVLRARDPGLALDGARHADVVEALVDRALSAMADEVVHLWS